MRLQITEKIFMKNKTSKTIFIKNISTMKSILLPLPKTQILVSPVTEILEDLCKSLKVCPMNFIKLRASNSISQNFQQ